MVTTEQKKFIDAFQNEREYELDGTQTYMLYDNKDQDNLLAMVYDEKELEDASKYYTSGVWFVCDNTVDSSVILNERKYKKKVKFPDVPEKQFDYGGDDERFSFNNKEMGDIR